MKWRHALGFCNRDTEGDSQSQNTIYISEHLPVETGVGNSKPNLWCLQILLQDLFIPTAVLNIQWWERSHLSSLLICDMRCYIF